MRARRFGGALIAAVLALGLLVPVVSVKPQQASAAELRDKDSGPKAKKPAKKKQQAGKNASAKKPAKKQPAKKKPSKKRPSKKKQAKKQRPAVLKARAPKPVKGRVCPVRDFAFGDGFGADRGSRKHMGIDMSAPRGKAIFAVETGRIDRTKRQSNKALQIVLKGKSGAKYYYGHMDRVFIRGGQFVKRGQVIGTMGDTGSPGQVHLHFEYWKSGGESDAIDPEAFIRRICRR